LWYVVVLVVVVVLVLVMVVAVVVVMVIVIMLGTYSNSQSANTKVESRQVAQCFISPPTSSSKFENHHHTITMPSPWQSLLP
jgi:flagellar basal body-associated protein FliL